MLSKLYAGNDCIVCITRFRFYGVLVGKQHSFSYSTRTEDISLFGHYDEESTFCNNVDLNFDGELETINSSLFLNFYSFPRSNVQMKCNMKNYFTYVFWRQLFFNRNVANFRWLIAIICKMYIMVFVARTLLSFLDSDCVELTCIGFLHTLC